MSILLKIWTGIYRQNIPLLLTCSSRRYASTKKAKTKIGFIGLGNMGSPMAKNVISKGHDVIVYDVKKESLVDLQEHGAQVTNSPKDVAEEVDCIITMLPNNDIVLDVYQGEKGILKLVSRNKNINC
ncbi:3-hydroxyisobutyrate dehydrogenase [Blattella germanica]|nr:3-hydroxyisobutyrate dehydrogenase [Blattella germanica]